jgi:hypothetical protein
MVRLFKEDKELTEKVKVDPIQVLEKLRDEAKENTKPWSDDWLLYRIAVGVLGALALVAAIGSVVLVAVDKDTPEVLVALGSAAVGALVGLFAPSPTSKK